MRVSTFRAILATAVLVGLVAPAALAGGLPKVPTATGTPGPGFFKVKPSSITYTGDGSGFLAGHRRPHHHRAAPLKWSSWTATGASGSGDNWLDNCMPNCAAGTFHLYPVKLKLSRPRDVHGHLIFTRMRVTYTGSKPGRVKHHPREIWKVVYSSGTYSWTFPIQ
jgi:hypothetical protein